MKRCFISIDLPTEIVKKLQSDYLYWRDGSLANLPIKWVSPEKWHLTLVFLGRVDEKRIDDLLKVIERVRVKTSFKCELNGLGTFGKGNDIKVIYLRVKSVFLGSLVDVMREELKKAGFDFDDKPFSAHITLGRFKKSLKDQQSKLLRDVCSEYAKDSWGDWMANDVVLYESDMREYKQISKINIVNG